MGDITKDIKSTVFDVPSIMNVKGFKNILPLLRSQHMTVTLISMFKLNVDLPDDFCANI